MMLLKTFENTFSWPIHYVGPHLSEGPLPAIFYFALSSEESLTTNPFHHPVTFWENSPLRTFSFTLPFHGEGFDNNKAIEGWANGFRSENNPLSHFLDEAEHVIQTLFDQEVLIENKVACSGLSRGGFIATHLASRFLSIPYILGFAPLTRLTSQSAFLELKENSIVESFALYHLASQLKDKSIRFYISNHDTRVGTDNCFYFIDTCSKLAFKERIRSPQFEMIISPPIGHMGHGTLPHVFEAGAKWLLEKVGTVI